MAISNSFNANKTILIVYAVDKVGVCLTVLLTFLTNYLTKLTANVFRAIFKVPTVLTNVLARLTLCSVGLHVLNNGTGRAIDTEGCGLVISLNRVGGSLVIKLIFSIIVVTVLC